MLCYFGDALLQSSSYHKLAVKVTQTLDTSGFTASNRSTSKTNSLVEVAAIVITLIFIVSGFNVCLTHWMKVQVYLYSTKQNKK